MGIMGLIVCLLIGAVIPTLILAFCIWLVDSAAFAEYGLGAIITRGFLINIGATAIWVAGGFLGLATGVIVFGLLGLLCGLAFWFVGLMNGHWGFGMTGWNAFVVTILLAGISLGLQQLLGVG